MLDAQRAQAESRHMKANGKQLNLKIRAWDVASSTTRVLCAVVFIFAAFCLVHIGIHPEHSKKYAQRKACINNLQAIDEIKHQWALDFKKQAGEAIAGSVIEELYAKKYNGKLPRCPADGTYSYGETVGAAPACSFPGHKLPK